MSPIRSIPADTFRREFLLNLRTCSDLSNPPFTDPDTTLRDSALRQGEAKPQVASAAKDNIADRVLANGSKYTNHKQSAERAIRRALKL